MKNLFARKNFMKVKKFHQENNFIFLHFKCGYENFVEIDRFLDEI